MTEHIVLGAIIDPLASLHPEKDTTLALLQKAEARGWTVYALELKDLFLKYGIAWGKARHLVGGDLQAGYTLGEVLECPLDQFDVLLMRKDPPVNMEYLYATYILEHAQQNGTLVVNSPQSLRDANEKMFTTWFPHCMPPTLVSCSVRDIKQFIAEHHIAVLKPLHGMGGQQIFKCADEDPNIAVIVDHLTHYGTCYAMVQSFIPDIINGDKRIFLLDGDPLPYALTRIPAAGDFRGNLAAGGTGYGATLTDRDRWICAQIGPTLREKGILFAGIDVIGEYLTEINVTSPTCIKEVENAFQVDLVTPILDCISHQLQES